MKKTLQECKEIIAKELGYKDFDEALWVDNVFFAETAIDLANKMFYEQSEWVSVETPPKEDSEVWIVENDKVSLAYYFGYCDKLVYMNGDQEHKPTYWIYLVTPSPPKQ